ncbi:hypothetical protein DFQ30_011361 [Apophysomyces sp. BC1015]|nr:hypothetical protein DFQ30_011361 [Apophysomyces sp. BC1015]
MRIALQPVVGKLTPGACAVDFGCGTGAWILDMATQYPECQFIGIEIAGMTDGAPDTLPLPNVRFEMTNGLEGLPLADASVDVVHLRSLYLTFKQDDWTTALREAYRILKPGGVIQLMESHNTPSGTVLIESFIETVRNILKSEDKDYDVAPKLATLLTNAGFQLTLSKKKKIHFASDGKLGEEFTAVNLRAFQSAQAYLASRMGLDEDDYRHRVEMVCAQCVQHDAHLVWYAYAARKPFG